MAGMLDRDGDAYECVEPDLGRYLWQILLPAIQPELRERLERHLQVCDACRLVLGLERSVAAGLRDGTLSLAPARSRLQPVQVTVGAGGALLACGIVLLMSLPPRPLEIGGATRSGLHGGGFVRPVEGEIVFDRTPGLCWAPVEGATGYRVSIREVAGGYAWQGETGAPALVVPDAAPVPRDRRLRVLVEPVPADLATQGSVSVVFEAAGWTRFLAYRWRSGALGAQMIAGGGAALLVLAAAASLLRRPSGRHSD